MVRPTRHDAILTIAILFCLVGSSWVSGFQLQLLEYSKGELLSVEQLGERRYAIVAKEAGQIAFITAATLNTETKVDSLVGPRLFVDRPVMSVSSTVANDQLYLALVFHDGNANRIVGRFDDRLELRMYRWGENAWEQVLGTRLLPQKELDKHFETSVLLESAGDNLRLNLISNNRGTKSIARYDLLDTSPLPEMKLISKSIHPSKQFSLKSNGDSLACCSTRDAGDSTSANLSIYVGKDSFTTSERLSGEASRSLVATTKSGDSIFAFVRKGSAEVELFCVLRPATEAERLRRVLQIEGDTELLDMALRGHTVSILFREGNRLRVKDFDLNAAGIEYKNIHEIELAGQGMSSMHMFSKIDNNLLHLPWRDMKPDPSNNKILLNSILQVQAQ
ncbi:MAG: hypothetical protein U0930_07025 [Pirellulales bacterium]